MPFLHPALLHVLHVCCIRVAWVLHVQHFGQKPVGMEGFEPPAPRSQAACASGLRHIPSFRRCDPHRTPGGARTIFHFPTSSLQSRHARAVGREGIEPPASGLKARRSAS